MRRAGVLLHPTSLPSTSGIGEIGPAARQFIGWLGSSGHRVWQMLPIHPVDRYGCPYASASATAAEPLLLSVDDLVRDGWLRQGERPYAASSGPVDYPAVRQAKGPALLAAADRVRATVDVRAWADAATRDWAEFAALRAHFDADWIDWPEALRERDPDALAAARDQHAEPIERGMALQWLFEQQWRALREAADAAGVELWGDVPFFVGLDSADVWCAPALWRLDDARRPVVVSGVPPDAFSADGQRWGHPLYDEPAHRERGHRWWLARMEHALSKFHRVRLDHFRGVSQVWEVPAHAETAASGRWVDGPGAPLLTALAARFPTLPLVAEDLGVITPDVEALRDDHGLPGMAILQFAWGIDPQHPAPGANPHLPHNHRRNQVVFTGTHDNDTLLGWVESTSEFERDRARRYLATDDRGLAWAHCRAAWQSVADVAIVPMQDLLGLPGSARMNVPGVQQGNWRWRMSAGATNMVLAARVREHLLLAGRG